jgi:hypothetical protein
MVLALLLIATIAVAGVAAGYVVTLSQQREKLAEAKYAVSLLTEFSDAVQSIGFEGQKAAYVRYGFQYGGWQVADGGVTSVSLSLNGGSQTLLAAQHALLEYVGGYSAYGTTRIYEARSQDLALVPSPSQSIVIYSYSGGGYTYSVADPRVYAAYSSSGGSSQVSVYVFVFSAPVLQGPARALMTLSGAIQHDSYSLNVFTPDPCVLNAAVGEVNGNLTIPVSQGGTVQVDVYTVTVTISFSL